MGMLDSALLIGGLPELLTSIKESIEEQTAWEVWMHKVYDKSYDEFKDAVNEEMSKEATFTPTSDEQQVSIINQSLAIAGFTLEEVN